MLANPATIASDLAIWAGAGTALLNILDWLLSTHQKQWIRDKSTNVWFWLSNQRNWNYLDAIRRQRVYSLVCLLGLLTIFISFFLLVILTNDQRSGRAILVDFVQFVPSSLLSIAAFFIAIKYGFGLYQMLLSGTKTYYIFLKLVLFFIFVNLVLFMLAGYMPRPRSMSVILDENKWLSALLVIIIFLIGTLVFLSVILALAVLSASYVILFIPILMMVFKALELVMARIAEHEKGPVLGAAALLTSLGVLVKTLVG